MNKNGKCPVCGGNGKEKIAVEWSFHSGGPKNWEYTRCENCGSCWLEGMRNWTAEQYSREIYNSDYGKVDVEYDGTRIKKNISRIFELLDRMGNVKRVLDYGGGNGLLTDLLRAAGYDSSCYDPYNRMDEVKGEYDCVTAIEVLEHEIDPDKIFGLAASKLREGGYFFATTETVDLKYVCDWFYANPRAGHNMLYSNHGLVEAGKKHGLRLVWNNGNWHVWEKAK